LLGQQYPDQELPLMAASPLGFKLKNAFAAHLRRCMTREMALPFHRIKRLAAEPHLLFCSIFLVRRPVGGKRFLW
jgi:hypothetical protein